jgi:hypothetical protein
MELLEQLMQHYCLCWATRGGQELGMRSSFCYFALEVGNVSPPNNEKAYLELYAQKALENYIYISTSVCQAFTYTSSGVL